MKHPALRLTLLASLIGAGLAPAARAEPLDAWPYAADALAIPAAPVPRQADASDWGTHAATPAAPPVPDDAPRSPDPLRANADAGKRDELQEDALTLADDPPLGPDDDPDAAPAGATTAAIRSAEVHFAAGSPVAADDIERPRHRAGLWRSLAAVLMAEAPDDEPSPVAQPADAEPVATAAPTPSARQGGAAAQQVMATLAAVLSDDWTGPGHGASAAPALEPSLEPAREPVREAAVAAPTSSDRVLSTLSAVLASPRAGDSSPASADLDLVIGTTAAQVDIVVEPVHSGRVDLEIDLMNATPVDIDTDPVIVRPVDVEIEIEIAPPSMPPVDLALDTAMPDEPAAAPRTSPFGSTQLAMNERALDQVRGGFTSDNGLRVSFGIERAVYVNGSLVSTTSLNVSDLGTISAGGRGTSDLTAAGSVAIIQSGSGNTFLPGTLAAGSFGTVIQNTLNDQKIQSLTTINATVNSLGILKSMNLQSNLRNAMIDSLRR